MDQQFAHPEFPFQFSPLTQPHAALQKLSLNSQKIDAAPCNLL